MAFPRSQRFVERETCAPPPTAYKIPSAFDENHCSSWVKPCTFDHHCGQCLSYSKGLDHNGQCNKSSEAAQAALCTKQRTCASSCILDNKENECCVQKKDGSNIPRFKKNLNTKLTEPKAPSFMTRPRHSIHNCFANSTEETDTSCQTNHFNRHLLNRRSVKIGKESKEKSSEDFNNAGTPSTVLIKPSLSDVRTFNVSYIVNDKNGGSNGNTKKNYHESKTSGVSTTSNKGAIPKRLSNVTDDMKETDSLENLDSSSTEDNILQTIAQPNLNFEHSESTEKEILEKDDSLQKEFLNNLDKSKVSNTDGNQLEEATSVNNIVSSGSLLEETTKNIKIEIENAIRIKSGAEAKKILKSYNLSSDIEDHIVFLITDEFIDDDYDSYVKDVTLEKLHKMEDTDLFQICKSLIRMYMEKLSVGIPKRKGTPKVKKGGFKKAELIKRKKRIPNNKNIWSEVEKIVRTSITGLKGEFKKEIYTKTEEKVDIIMTKLANVLLKAEESIESSCERTTVDLINKLGKMIQQ